MQRLFSTFADGWPGGGLLVQRLVVGGALLYSAAASFRSGPPYPVFAIDGIGAAAGVLLIAGLWTPIAGLLVAILEPILAFVSPGHATVPLFLATLGITLAMIGPGTWSIDALLFGRKQIFPPDR